ncbi:MAG: TRAP transporter substrate-binding protein DctP [Synergistales bacterium]|nr:TRAP transporter substrate-binding protein DctP [Synergistales bacterium]
MASLMVVAFAFGAFAAEPEYTLRFAGSYAPDHPGTATQYAIAEEVAEKTDGKVKIEVYPASQLGDYVQVYEDVIRGSVDMGYFYITGQYNQMLEICSMPYLTTSWEGLKDVFSPGSFWYETYEEAHAKVGVQLLGVYVDSFISLATVKEPADPFDPEANHEILVRIPPSELYKVTMKDLNYDTVTINWSDLYTAMQTGVCDGYIGGTASLNYFTFRDLIKNFFPVRMFVENVSYIMNKDLFEEMPEEYSRIILEACQKQASKSIVEARKQEEKYQRKLAEEHDVVIHDVSQEEIDALAAHVRKVSWPKFSKMFGEEVIEGLLEDVQQ